MCKAAANRVLFIYKIFPQSTNKKLRLLNIYPKYSGFVQRKGRLYIILNNE